MVPDTGITQEYDRLGGALDDVGKEEFWASLQAFLSTVVGFDECVVLSYPPEAAPVCPYHTLDPAAYAVLINEYLAGPYLLDPFYAVINQSDRTGVIALREAAPDKFRSTTYYEMHYSRTGIQDELGLFFRSVSGQCDVVSLLRVGDSKRFSKRDTSQLRSRSAALVALGEMHLRNCRSLPGDERAWQKRWTFAEALEGEQFNLSQREIEISELILRGHSSLSIALTLGIVEGTVKIHRKNIYRKLYISSQAELFSLFLSRIFDRFG